MRLRAAIAICALTAVGLLSTACDAAPEFVVVNHTQQTLITRPVFEECGTGGSNKSDYLDEEIVPPMTEYIYSDVYGVHAGQSSLQCVEVMTEDRKLVLAEPYEDGRTYEVTAPLTVTGSPMPAIEDLPGQSGFAELYEDLGERPLGAVLFIVWMSVLAVPILAAAIYAAFLTVRFMFRHYRPTL